MTWMRRVASGMEESVKCLLKATASHGSLQGDSLMSVLNSMFLSSRNRRKSEALLVFHSLICCPESGLKPKLGLLSLTQADPTSGPVGPRVGLRILGDPRPGLKPGSGCEYILNTTHVRRYGGQRGTLLKQGTMSLFRHNICDLEQNVYGNTKTLSAFSGTIEWLCPGARGPKSAELSQLLQPGCPHTESFSQTGAPREGPQDHAEKVMGEKKVKKVLPYKKKLKCYMEGNGQWHNGVKRKLPPSPGLSPSPTRPGPDVGSGSRYSQAQARSDPTQARAFKPDPTRTTLDQVLRHPAECNVLWNSTISGPTSRPTGYASIHVASIDRHGAGEIEEYIVQRQARA
ncbi:hypothetical protein B0H13DRAFT_1878299 [Mycena leptocephala]|nr:hypothetical protein B0H13DRAFT_1878299 [Mycena leptocephala]